MAILIELNPDEMRDSSTFSRNAELIAITVSSASYSATSNLSPKPGQSLATGIKFNAQKAVSLNNSIRANTAFEFIISRNTTPKETDVLFRFECVLTATYQMRRGYKPSHAEIAAFHKANVIFNCWPYFREFVQSSASRMNIPPPPLPFVRVHIESKAKEITHAARKVSKRERSPQITRTQ